MQVRIRHHDRLRLKRPVLPARPDPGRARVAVSAAITGLTANTTYHFRISATNTGGTSKGLDETFKTTLAERQHPAGRRSVTQTSATLNAKVNPNGVEVTECKFEYGTTTAYGSSAPCSPLPGSGTNAVAVSRRKSRASPPTPPTTSGSRRRTPAARPKAPTKRSKRRRIRRPSCTSRRPSIAQTTATLNGTVNPNGGEVTECKFEYGTTTCLRLKRAVHPARRGRGRAPSRSPRRSRASPRTPPTTSGSSATNAGGTSKGCGRNVQNAARTRRRS